MNDPLKDLAPFLEQVRKNPAKQQLPDHLTARLMEARQVTLPPVAPLPEEGELPRRFGPYLLESILGQGSSGTVYRAYDEELERSVAVKVLAPSLKNHPDATLRFLREARAMAQLSDDNLMPLFAVHQDTPSPSLTMPLLEGETLQTRLERAGPLSPPEAVPIAIQICRGLQKAHQANLIHRDLKPSNIFLEKTTEGLRARVMDFGLAQAEGDPRMTREGEVAGTPAFMAPEQIDGLSLDGRADLYGLGSTLYMALVGQPPFEGKTLTSTLKQVASQAAPSLSRQVPGVPSWLSRLVADLLQKNREQRPRDVGLVLRLLEEGRSRKIASAKASKPALTLVALTVLLLLGGLTFLLMPSEPSARTDRPPTLGERLATFQSGDTIEVPAGTHSLASLDLAGKSLRLVGSKDGSRLTFPNLTAPAFAHAGSLELVNLTIDFSRSQSDDGVALVDSSGPQVSLINCRIEQAQNGNSFPNRTTLIEPAAGSETLISGCEIYTFQSITWQMRGASNLTLEDTLIISPGLTFSSEREQSSGRITVKNSTCLHQIFSSHDVASLDAPLIHLRLENALIECSHAFLWLPLGDEELLRESLSYEADKVLFFFKKSLINTEKRLRLPARKGGVLDDWREPEWNEFWGTKQRKVNLRGGSLLSRSEQDRRDIAKLTPAVLRLPPDTTGMGADLSRVGPKHNE